MIRECNMSVQASNDDLMHWKYIKKKKGKNGKWIYYYDRTANKLTNLEAQKAKAQYDYDRAFGKYWNDRYNADLNSARKENDKIGIDNVNRWYRDYRIKHHTKQYIKDVPVWDAEDMNIKKYAYDLTEAEQDVLRRSDTIGGHVDKFMAKNGRKIASDLNSYSDAVSNTVAKAKRFVTNLFRK